MQSRELGPERGLLARLYRRFIDRPGTKRIIESSAPIFDRDHRHVIARLQVSQTEDRWLSLRDRALTRMLNLTLIISVVAVLATLIFAARLALRLSRLRDASESALTREGLVTTFPETARARRARRRGTRLLDTVDSGERIHRVPADAGRQAGPRDTNTTHDRALFAGEPGIGGAVAFCQRVHCARARGQRATQCHSGCDGSCYARRGGHQQRRADAIRSRPRDQRRRRILSGRLRRPAIPQPSCPQSRPRSMAPRISSCRCSTSWWTTRWISPRPAP